MNVRSLEQIESSIVANEAELMRLRAIPAEERNNDLIQLTVKYLAEQTTLLREEKARIDAGG